MSDQTPDTPLGPKWQQHPYVSQVGGDACMVCGGWREGKQHKPAIDEDKSTCVQRAIQRLNDATSMMGWPPSAHTAIRERDTPPDPWQDIEAELLKAIGYPHVTVADLPPDTFVARFYAARQQVEAQHAEAVNRLECEKEAIAARSDEAIAHLRKQYAADLATLRAERDAASAAGYARAKEDCAEENGRLNTLRYQAEVERDAAHQEIARLRDALEKLLDEQNDAPLERRRVQWQAAVDAGRAALSTPEHQG